jgi:soluble lytic murein transglycosylase-like protein
MRKYALFTIPALLLAGCSQRINFHKQDLWTVPLTQETVELLLAEQPPDLDTGLYLYRNPLARKMVVDFYNGISGDPRITEPILHYAEVYDIPLPLAFSLAWAESNFRIKARNENTRSIDRGLFQLNSRTFASLSEEDFYDPATNAKYGLSHLRFCLDEGGNELIALAMYNAGTYGVRTGTPYSTLKYMAKLFDYRESLKQSFQEFLKDTVRIAQIMNKSGDS